MSQRNSLHVNTRLRNERLQRGWSQQNVAHRLGITTVTVNRWERGVQQPTPLFRMKLCQLFGKSEDELGLYNEQHALDPAPASTTNQKRAALDPARTEQQAVAPQGSNLPPTSTHDDSSLPQDIPTASAPQLSNTSTDYSPISHIPPFIRQNTCKAYTSLTRAMHLSPKRLFSLTLFMLLLICIVVLTPFFLQLKNPHLPAPSLSTSHLPTSHLPTPGPTLSPSALADGHVLYQTAWSKSPDGWSVSADWQWSQQNGGTIKTDRTTNGLLIAPYQVSTATYAIEARIQRFQYSDIGGKAYGLLIGKIPTNGVVCGVGTHEEPEHFFIGQLQAPIDQDQPIMAGDLFNAPTALDKDWHTYRVEVTPGTLRFFLDRKFIGQVKNTIHTQSGQVGIYAVGAFITIASFTVFALA